MVFFNEKLQFSSENYGSLENNNFPIEFLKFHRTTCIFYRNIVMFIENLQFSNENLHFFANNYNLFIEQLQFSLKITICK